MSIDRTQPTTPISQVQSRESSDAAPARARQPVTATSENGTQVVLSGALTQLTKSSANDINTARVETLKTAIRNGELKMDTGKIADALIQQAKEYVEGY
ncbi:MAG: Negative regulator of flagellin synthesis [Candidatus Erwinia impunctatus]|nr:Negative regulator of flagellin synthesis [Culicoides impunctatus]